MRIISNFKDYYDNVSAHGVDTTIVYNRKQEVIPVVDIRGCPYKNMAWIT